MVLGEALRAWLLHSSQTMATEMATVTRAVIINIATTVVIIYKNSNNSNNSSNADITAVVAITMSTTLLTIIVFTIVTLIILVIVIRIVRMPATVAIIVTTRKPTIMTMLAVYDTEEL